MEVRKHTLKETEFTGRDETSGFFVKISRELRILVSEGRSLPKGQGKYFTIGGGARKKH